MNTPRRGQWVLVHGLSPEFVKAAGGEDPVLGIAAEVDHGKFKTIGDIIVSGPKVARKHDKVFVAGKADLNKWRVDIVDPEDGFARIGMVLVSIDRLEPLLDKKRIPARRLATMDPSFTPVP